MNFKRLLFWRWTLLVLAMALVQLLIVSGNNVLAADKLLGQVSMAPTAVHLAGEEVFTMTAPAGGFSVLERTIIVERNLNNALKACTNRSPSAVEIVYINNIPVVRFGGFHIVTADSESAKNAGLTMHALAETWVGSMQAALADQTKVSQYVADLGGDYIPTNYVTPYRRARLEAARLNHAAFLFREDVPPALVSADSLASDGMKSLSHRDPLAAAESFRNAIAMCPENSRAHYGLGKTLLQLGHVDSAIAELQMARWLEPDYALVHIALGQAYESQGKANAAIKQYQEASLLQPDNPEPYLLIADIRENRNDVGKSVTELTSALKQIPDSEYISVRRKDQLVWRLRRPM